MMTQRTALPWRMGLGICVPTILIVLAGHLRPPWAWSKTQFLFNYDFGLQRRALLGEILALLRPDGLNEAFVMALAATLTLAATACLAIYVISGLKQTDGSGVILVLFATSVGLACTIGNTGYLDAILIVLAILALTRNADAWGVVMRTVLCLVGAFFHENMLPYFTVLIGFDLWIRRPDLATGKRLAVASVPIGITAVAVVLLFVFGTHDFAVAPSILASMAERALDFEMRSETLVPVVDFPEDRPPSLAGVWATPYYRFRLLAYGLVGAAIFLLHIVPVLKAAGHRPVADRLGILAATLAPAALLLVAFDVSRFVALTLVNVFLVIAALSRVDGEFADALPRFFTVPLVILILVVNGQVVLRDLNAYHLRESGFPTALWAQQYWLGADPGPRWLR